MPTDVDWDFINFSFLNVGGKGCFLLRAAQPFPSLKSPREPYSNHERPLAVSSNRKEQMNLNSVVSQLNFMCFSAINNHRF